MPESQILKTRIIKTGDGYYVPQVYSSGWAEWMSIEEWPKGLFEWTKAYTTWFGNGRGCGKKTVESARKVLEGYRKKVESDECKKTFTVVEGDDA
jgi:hypothetical protein